MGTSNTINPNEAIFVPGRLEHQLNRPYYQQIRVDERSLVLLRLRQRALQLVPGDGARARRGRGWTLQGSYTYQRQWGDGWGYDSNYYFLYDRAAGTGYSNLLPRQQWTLLPDL